MACLLLIITPQIISFNYNLNQTISNIKINYIKALHLLDYYSSMKVFILIALLLSTYASASDELESFDWEDVVTACRNSYWNLEPLRRDDTDYESPTFTYMALEWTIVFNFCRSTIRTCMWHHFSAFLNSAGEGLRCLPTVTKGNWDSAEYSLEYENGVKVARIAWPSKVRGGFEMWITCNKNTNYRFNRIDVKSSPWRMYLESSHIC